MRCSTLLCLLVLVIVGCSNNEDGPEQGRSASNRLAAVEELSEMRPVTREAINGLVGALWDRDLSVRRAAREALLEIGLVAVPALAEAVEGEYQKAAVTHEAKHPIKLIGKQLEVLIEQLEFPDESVRTTAARSLREAVPEARTAYESWLGLMDSENPKVREYIVVSLEGFWEEVWEAHSLLTEALEDENQDIRDSAAIVLREIEDQARTTVSKLREALEDQNKSVQRGAARALKEIEKQGKL